MKTIIFTFFALATTVFAAPQYSLNSICSKYGKMGQCSSVPFCMERQFKAGCYLAQGAPLHVKGLCEIQTLEQGCHIMAAQGNCTWVPEDVSSCSARFETL